MKTSPHAIDERCVARSQYVIPLVVALAWGYVHSHAPMMNCLYLANDGKPLPDWFEVVYRPVTLLIEQKSFLNAYLFWWASHWDCEMSYAAIEEGPDWAKGFCLP